MTQELTRQGIFDTVTRHLFTQGIGASMGAQANHVCAYRGDGGTKCAVGVLIPDDLYDSSMDGGRGILVTTLVENFVKLAFLRPHLPLLMDLQAAHDDLDSRDDAGKSLPFNRTDLATRLHFVGMVYSLDVTLVKELAPEGWVYGSDAERAA